MLAALEAGFRAGRAVQVLSGPPGIGKTLLLHVLATRLADAFRCLYLPYASLPWPDLCAWVLGLLGEPPAALPDRKLLEAARARSERGRPLLLLVDDASGLPPESASGLAALVDEADGALRLLLVPLDDARAGRVLARFEGEEHRLSRPMTAAETAAYVEARLAHACAGPEVFARFDDATVAALHRASGGLPTELHRLATHVVRGDAGALPGEHLREELELGVDDAPWALEVDLEEDEEPVWRHPDAREGGTPGGGAEAWADAAPHLGAPTPPPERASWVWIVSVNAGIWGFVFALLWIFGYFPPP